MVLPSAVFTAERQPLGQTVPAQVPLQYLLQDTAPLLPFLTKPTRADKSRWLRCSELGSSAAVAQLPWLPAAAASKGCMYAPSRT